jgi:hypothetical protein
LVEAAVETARRSGIKQHQLTIKLRKTRCSVDLCGFRNHSPICSPTARNTDTGGQINLTVALQPEVWLS